jgi:FlaA1/EpsC-like NDP-sugar epimerase
LFVGLKVVAFYFFQIYRFSWSYVSLYELLKVVKVLTLCSLIISSIVLLLTYEEAFRGFSRSIFLIDYLLS